MTTIDVSSGAISVHCPFCGFHHTFVPPVLRSEPCGGCNLFVCETEWHDALMDEVAGLVKDRMSVTQEAVRYAR